MDKPFSMSAKDYLVKVVSVRMNIPSKTIEAIVDDQLKAANEAMVNTFSVELSGFGKFTFNHKKAQKKMEKQLSKKATFEKILLREGLTDTQKRSYQLKLDNTIKWIEGLKPKLDEFKRYSGGMEEHIVTPFGDERDDKGNVSTEDGIV